MMLEFESTFFFRDGILNGFVLGFVFSYSFVRAAYKMSKPGPPGSRKQTAGKNTWTDLFQAHKKYAKMVSVATVAWLVVNAWNQGVYCLCLGGGNSQVVRFLAAQICWAHLRGHFCVDMRRKDLVDYVSCNCACVFVFSRAQTFFQHIAW